VHIVPRDADQVVDAKRDQRQHDEQDDDNNGDDVVLLHLGCCLSVFPACLSGRVGPWWRGTDVVSPQRSGSRGGVRAGAGPRCGARGGGDDGDVCDRSVGGAKWWWCKLVVLLQV